MHIIFKGFKFVIPELIYHRKSWHNRPKDKEDVLAFQTYKLICNRRIGRTYDLSNPGLDHFGSDEFCFESWKNYLDTTFSEYSSEVIN